MHHDYNSRNPLKSSAARLERDYIFHLVGKEILSEGRLYSERFSAKHVVGKACFNVLNEDVPDEDEFLQAFQDSAHPVAVAARESLTADGAASST